MRFPFLLASAIILFACSEERAIKVGLQPFDGFDQKLVDTVFNAIERTYGAKVYALKSEPIPKESFINVKSPRYRADKLIAILKNQKSDTVDYIMGLTNEDISFTKTEAGEIKAPKSTYEDWGIFGLGFRPGPSCVASTFRLGNKGQAVLIERLKKVTIHELGHNMGLEHCESEFCVMKDAAESIKTVDLIEPQLCDRCKRKLSIIL